jgi:phenylalanyl-tRNA synthetase alpha subunit
MDVKYNFDHLNLAENHPTRDVSETFYLSNNQYTLRSQMTSQSVFVMDNNQNEEIRYAMPG